MPWHYWQLFLINQSGPCKQLFDQTDCWRVKVTALGAVLAGCARVGVNLTYQPIRILLLSKLTNQGQGSGSTATWPRLTWALGQLYGLSLQLSWFWYEFLWFLMGFCDHEPCNFNSGDSKQNGGGSCEWKWC